jgi:hypothetical protein
MARISLTFRIRLPVRVVAWRAPVQRIPTEPPFDQTDRSNDPKKNQRQYYPSADKRQHFSQGHPGFVWQLQYSRKHEPQQQQHRTDDYGHVRHCRELSTIKPPQAEQREHAPDDQAELSLGSQGWLLINSFDHASQTPTGAAAVEDSYQSIVFCNPCSSDVCARKPNFSNARRVSS